MSEGKRVGRPPRNPGEGKRPTITFRCRSPLHERVLASAREGDRSISEEVERRLDASFERGGATLEDVRQIIRDEVVAAVRAALKPEHQANSLMTWYGQTRADLYDQYGKNAANPSPYGKV